MITNLINLLANFVVYVIGILGYPGIFLLMFAESCGIPMPSEVIMPFSGFLVADGRLTFWGVVLIGTLGNLAGSLLAYWIGKIGGRPLIEKYGKYILISEKEIRFAEQLFKKYGNKITLTARVLPILRTIISLPAGISKMNFKKFILYAGIGSFPWCLVLTYAGVLLEENWGLLAQYFNYFDIVIIAFFVILVILFVMKKLKKKY